MRWRRRMRHVVSRHVRLSALSLNSTGDLNSLPPLPWKRDLMATQVAPTARSIRNVDVGSIATRRLERLAEVAQLFRIERGL